MAIRVPSRTRQRAYGYVKYTPVLTCPTVIQVSADDTAMIVKVLGSLPLGATEVRFYFYEDGETPTLGSGYVVGTLGDDGYYGELADPEQGVLYKVIATYFGAGFESSGCSGAEAGILVDCPELLTPDNNFNYENDVIADYDQAVTWAAVEHATGYNVYLSANDDPYELIATTTDLNYTFEGLTLNVSYRWSITSLNGDFESSACGSRAFIGTPSGTTVEIFDNPGEYEWEINDFAVSVEIRVLGAGGGGGGGAPIPGGSGVSGGGGGGGGCGCVQTFLAGDIVSPVTITVGVGGSGGIGAIEHVNGSTSGTAGEPSSFGSYLVAGGGGGGSRGAENGLFPVWGSGGGGGGLPNSGSNGAQNTNVDNGGTTGGGKGGFSLTPGGTPSTDFGGGGGGGGMQGQATIGSVSLWGGPGGGGGSSSPNSLAAEASPGANGTNSTGTAIEMFPTPQGGAAATNTADAGYPASNGQNGRDPGDPLMLAGSSGGGGGGSAYLPNWRFNAGKAGHGGNGGRGAGGGGGGAVYAGSLSPPGSISGNGGAGGNGYVVIISTNA